MIGHCSLTHCAFPELLSVNISTCDTCEYRELSAHDIEETVAGMIEGLKNAHGIPEKVCMRQKELLRLVTDSNLLTTTPGEKGPRFWLFGCEVEEHNELPDNVFIYVIGERGE